MIGIKSELKHQLKEAFVIKPLTVFNGPHSMFVSSASYNDRIRICCK